MALTKRIRYSLNPGVAMNPKSGIAHVGTLGAAILATVLPRVTKLRAFCLADVTSGGAELSTNTAGFLMSTRPLHDIGMINIV